MKDNPNAFKHLIGAEVVKKMGAELSVHYPKFNLVQFKKLIPKLNELELKQRVRLIREELAKLLPQDFQKSCAILLKVSESEKLDGFDLWPIADFIQVHGIKDPHTPLKALYQLTQKFSGEFAVRPFLAQHQKVTLAQFKIWSQDKSVHVRRLVSEGSRPRLPWGEKLSAFIKDPSLTIPLLEKLKYDPELYVRKSVANHLNDISKDHPKLVTALLEKWNKEALKQSAEKQERIAWITRHALRVLIKNGNKEALALMGVKHGAKVSITDLVLNKNKFVVGDELTFSFKLASMESGAQNLIVDYVVHHLKSNGKTSPKVFKLKSFLLGAKEKTVISKKHSLRAVSTRKYYSGTQFIEIQVNGVGLERVSFELTCKK